MYESIATAILLGSLLGIGVILIRKMPVLKELSPAQGEELSLVEGIKQRFRKNRISSALSLDKFLQKLLRKSKVLTLKTENKISCWLEQLQRKPENNQNDGYWQELKKTIQKKD